MLLLVVYKAMLAKLRISPTYRESGFRYVIAGYRLKASMTQVSAIGGAVSRRCNAPEPYAIIHPVDVLEMLSVLVLVAFTPATLQYPMI